jgi:hypothetical protein
MGLRNDDEWVVIKREDLAFMVGWIDSFTREIRDRGIDPQSLDLSRANGVLARGYEALRIDETHNRSAN